MTCLRDRQSDGQTTYCCITALCVVSRGKNLTRQEQSIGISLKAAGDRQIWKGLVSLHGHNGSEVNSRNSSAAPAPRGSHRHCLLISIHRLAVQ